MRNADAERKSLAERQVTGRNNRDLGDVEEEQAEGQGMPTMRNLLTKEQDNGRLQDSPLTKQHSTSFAGSFIASLRRKASRAEDSRRSKSFAAAQANKEQSQAERNRQLAKHRLM